MKILKRNKQTFYVCKYLRTINIVTNSMYSGEKDIIYSQPIMLTGSISPARGYTEISDIGQSLLYDKTIIIDDLTIDIDEKDIVFIDVTPRFANTELLNKEYTIYRISKSLNYISIDIKKTREYEN